MSSSLLQFSGHSLYCPVADVHIDPWRPVEKAIITHAHSDHAKSGHSHYLAHKDSEVFLRYRLGEQISLQTVEYGETFHINGVQFSLHPAGHILGSAQVRIEHKGEVWVFSGDYKIEDDHFSQPFELVKCNAFITEATFGLPIYHWQPQDEIFAEINAWCAKNQIEGKASLLMGYSMGKMQRILKNLPTDGREIYAHGAVYGLNEKLRLHGYDLPRIHLVTPHVEKKTYQGKLILAPAGADNSSWAKKLGPVSTGFCSGWMVVRGAKNRRALDQGFALSDHVDWDALQTTVKNTGAEKIYVTHGFTSVLSRWFNEIGISAAEVKTMYGDDEEKEENVTVNENPELPLTPGL
jgi:putative mRNA 3-end processing factor